MKNKIKVVLLLPIILNIMNSFADPLALSNAEMQKLQRYFPSEENGTHLIWKGNPLSITLPINQEKRIIFASKILPDLKNALTTDQLRILNDDKSIYLTALKPFSSTRMYVTLQDSGEVILVDLSTNEIGNRATLYIDTQQQSDKNNSTVNAIETNESDNSSSSTDNNTFASDSDSYVTLIRFAWQQLYAPDRLMSNTLNISRASMHTLPMLSTLIYGDKVYAHPESSWVYNDTYVTAVELRNKYPHATTIHLSQDLCGDWQAASLYPRSILKPAGDKEGDNTVLFLVSKEPFSEAMEVCNGDA